MNASGLDLNSIRARKARMARKIGNTFYMAVFILSLTLVCVSVFLFILHFNRIAYGTIGLGLAVFMFCRWYKQDLELLPPYGEGVTGRLAGSVLGKFDPNKPQTPKTVWASLQGDWQLTFICNHFLVSPQEIEELLRDPDIDMDTVWNEAARLAKDTASETIEAGHVATALLLTSPSIKTFFSHIKISMADVEALAHWLGRINTIRRADKPYFGGIGRDWANGFTPQLNQFGHNISLSIERNGGHFGTLATSPGVMALKNAFAQGASAIALIGSNGIGKTSHVHALAQLLLAEKNDRNLEHRQIIELNPSLIISNAKGPGQLEQIILRLMGETAHAGHIVLFLDDAQLFFKDGPGSFDLTQILLPVVQSKAVQIVFAMTPNEFQELKGRSSAFAGLLTPVILSQPDQKTTMRILEDNAMVLEYRNKVLITYESLKEAYRLSGRYEQEAAYPGKAIQLLEQSLPYAEQKVVTANSIQLAIEQTRGVKVGAAAPIEVDKLLNLEAEIHKRMINQTRAVQVVASALRRARAGVSNPKRPLGSFLFLGPTGVGKTELAKAVAATYFGSESNILRLDMSEYQQPEDINRLLSDGAGQATSLIMAVRQQPFSVILLDEIEKAHLNILNLLLQLLDEGQLTDTGGRIASFKDCIVIATSNAGAQEIRERIGNGEALESFEAQFTDNLIKSNQFKPELLNRFDEIVLFRPLTQDELAQVVSLMVEEINKTLGTQNISVELTRDANLQIVAKGYDARLGARPMRRMLQRTVEDEIANRILRGTAQPGDHIVLDARDLAL